MKEANLFKYYFVRYFFLALATMQGLAALTLLLQFEDSPKNRFAIFIFFTLAMILISIHFLVFTKVKRVAVSKKKVAVINRYRTKEYDWDDVKELKLLPFLNMYSLKLKGKRKKIYFLPAHDSEAIFGIFGSSMELIQKK